MNVSLLHTICDRVTGFCPGGASDGSPVIYRWVIGWENPAESPVGTIDVERPARSVVPPGLQKLPHRPSSQH